MPWSSRVALLDELQRDQSGYTIRDAFTAVGASSPVKLNNEQKSFASSPSDRGLGRTHGRRDARTPGGEDRAPLRAPSTTWTTPASGSSSALTRSAPTSPPARRAITGEHAPGRCRRRPVPSTCPRTHAPPGKDRVISPQRAHSTTPAATLDAHCALSKRRCLPRRLAPPSSASRVSRSRSRPLWFARG